MAWPQGSCCPFGPVRKPEAAVVFSMLIPSLVTLHRAQGFFVRISVQATPPSPWDWLIKAQPLEQFAFPLSFKRLKMLTGEGQGWSSTVHGEGMLTTAIPSARVLARLPQSGAGGRDPGARRLCGQHGQGAQGRGREMRWGRQSQQRVYL